MGSSLYVRPRPIRTALAIDQKAFVAGGERCEALLDAIVVAAMHSWGGRQNAITVFDPDGDLNSGDWNELECFDPDIVHAFAPLTEKWIQRFHDRLLPWRITLEDFFKEPEPTNGTIESSWLWLHGHIPGLATPPTLENLKKISANKLLMIEFAKDCPLELRRFFHRNFGTFHQWFDSQSLKARRIGWLEDILKTIEVERVIISDVSSACTAVDLFAGNLLSPNRIPPLRFLAPTQLSAIDLLGGVPRGPYQHSYRIFVGDSLRDFTAYWNELRLCSCWRVPHRFALWISNELIGEERFVDALRRFLYEYSGKHSSGSRRIEITSETLTVEALQPLATAFKAGSQSFPSFIIENSTRRNQLAELVATESTRPYSILNSTNAERIRMADQVETLSVSEPKVLVGDGRWAVDVQVEFGASNRFRSPKWWCLPRRTGTALAQWIFRAPARVGRSNLFAVEIERRSNHGGYQRTPELHVALPAESEVVEALMHERPFAFNADDLRKDRLTQSNLIAGVDISDKGQNLRGLIEAFGDFWTAERFCERRFWREAFAKLAGHDARTSEALSLRIKNSIRKALAGNRETKEQISERILEKILPHVHGALEDQPLTYAELASILEKIGADQPSQRDHTYQSGETVVHEMGVTILSEKEVKTGLNELLACNVLRPGIIVRCKHCGMESWFHVDEVRQFNECAGCGNPRPLTVDAEWRFRLNSLTKRCVSARIFAVLQALAAIAHSSTQCFFYSPSLNLYRPGESGVWREVDVACVSDGKLLIGEVKDGAFDQEELNRFADVAELLRPDRAAVFVAQGRNNTKVLKYFRELEARLKRFDIRAELHELPSM